MPLRNSLNDLAYFAAINRISPAAFFLSYVAANADCETRPVEGLKMKKICLALLHSSWHLRRSHKHRTAVRDYLVIQTPVTIDRSNPTTVEPTSITIMKERSMYVMQCIIMRSTITTPLKQSSMPHVHRPETRSQFASRCVQISCDSL
ncbi:hypothetical protein ACFS07_34720 [Undibacterium arcticum]